MTSFQISSSNHLPYPLLCVCEGDIDGGPLPIPYYICVCVRVIWMVALSLSLTMCVCEGDMDGGPLPIPYCVCVCEGDMDGGPLPIPYYVCVCVRVIWMVARPP